MLGVEYVMQNKEDVIPSLTDVASFHDPVQGSVSSKHRGPYPAFLPEFRSRCMVGGLLE